MKTTRYIYFSFFVFLTSCTFNEESVDITGKESPVILKESVDRNYMPHKVNEALPGSYGVYSMILDPAEYQIGISSHKDGAMPGGSIVSYYSGESQIMRRDISKVSNAVFPELHSFVNDIEISQENLSSSKSDMQPSGLIGVFGKRVSIKLSLGDLSRADVVDCGEVDFYVPAAISILSPSANTESMINPLCYYKDFVLEWNADINNANGVIIAVEWNGAMILGEDITDTYVRRICNVPDNGKCTLPIELFEGIPDTAFCNLTLLRGNIDEVKIDDYLCKIVGETHHQISFILIREIRNS